MRTITLPRNCDEAAFRHAAKSCLAQQLPPAEILFATEEAGALFESAQLGDAPAILLPRRFVTLMSDVLCHSADDRFTLLYRLLWRIHHHGERALLDNATDPDVQRAARYARAVERDVYRMHAFVRFTERTIDNRQVFTAWFEPQHRVLHRAAPFFVDRFANMDWLIATPFGTVAWQDKVLSFGPPAERPEQAADSVLDELWTTYYRTIFNPARLKVKAMMAQMPKRHWATMPETAQIPELLQQAGARVRAMDARPPDMEPRYALAAAAQVPVGSAAPADALDAVRQAARCCRQCPLYAPATQTVFGEGPVDAELVFVGEQPGDQEDLAGRPFVGPAGQVFDRALAQVGIDRSRVYVTNAVKHFKFEPRGKRRIHSKPGTVEVVSCRNWLQQELDIIRPRLVVALGATAALSLAGRAMPVNKSRGAVHELLGRHVLVTVHPSYLLRLPDAAAAGKEFGRFVADLTVARQSLN